MMMIMIVIMMTTMVKRKKEVEEGEGKKTEEEKEKLIMWVKNKLNKFNLLSLCYVSGTMISGFHRLHNLILPRAF